MKQNCLLFSELVLFVAVLSLGACNGNNDSSSTEESGGSDIGTNADSQSGADSDTGSPPDGDTESSAVTDSASTIVDDTTADSDTGTVTESDHHSDTGSGGISDTDADTDAVFDTGTGADSDSAARQDMFDIMAAGYVYAGDWHGFSWTSSGDISGSTITPDGYADFSGAETQLCASGSLPENYDAFGIIGLNVNQSNADDAPLSAWTPTEANTGVYVDIANPNGVLVRLSLEAPGGQNFCTDISPGGQTVYWANLIADCWASGGAAYNGEPIERVMLVVPGDAQGEVVFNLCLNEMYPIGSNFNGEDVDSDTEAPTDSDAAMDSETDTGSDVNADTGTAIYSDSDPDPDSDSAVDSGMKMGTNFWNLGWGIWDDTFKSDASFAAGSDPWNPAFLEEIRPYTALRFMDWAETNDSPEQRWDDRTPANAPSGSQNPLAWEWMIDLCNRTDADIWVTLPHMSDANYSYQLALLLQQQLDPQLKVYVEWSNETWNTMFSQTDWAYDRGNELGLDTDPWSAAFKYHVYAAVRVFEQFDSVFGADNPRIIKVISGQTGNEWTTGLHMDALADSQINPNNVTADAYATAPYFGHGLNGNDGSAIGALRTSMENSVNDVASQAAVVASYGLRFLAYEGGQHVYQGGADVINARPEMYQIYTDYFNGVAPYFDVFMHYLHNGQWNDGGAWGAEEYVGQPLSEAHKLRAIYDWIDANR